MRFFLDFKGEGQIEQIPNLPHPLFAYGFPSSVFFRLPSLRKRLAIQVIQVSGVVSGPVFFAISTGCRNLAKHWGVAGTAYAYGLP